MFNKNLLIKTCLIVFGLGSLNSQADYCAFSSSDIKTLYFGVEISLPDPDHPHTIPTAHTDIEIPLLFSNGWDVHIKTDLPDANTRVETEDALFPLDAGHVVSFAGSVPSGWQFVGVGPDEPFWYYNQNDPPAAGVDSQDMTTESNELCLWDPNDPGRNATGLDKWLQMNLLEVRGPAGGHVSMFQESGPTPTVFFSTYAGGITGEDVFYIKAKSHSHNSWAFTKTGLYEVDIQVSTFHLCDDSLVADVNDDCIVNLEDFALMAGQWLVCGSSFGLECP